MARIRTIKPEFWTDEKLAPLRPIDRLVFLGLISQADDGGRLVDNVRLIDGLLFPETEESSRESLEILRGLGRIIRYTSESGQKLIQVGGWDKHQNVQKPSKYVLPPPTDAEVSRESPESLQRLPVSDPRPTTYDLRPTTMDLGGGPGEHAGADAPEPAGKPKARTKRNTQLPTDWQPTADHRKLAAELGTSIDAEVPKFRDHAAATGRVLKDWDAGFRTWLRKAQEFQRAPPAGSEAGAVRNEMPGRDRRNGPNGDPGPANAGDFPGWHWNGKRYVRTG